MTLDLDFTASVTDVNVSGINKYLKASTAIDIEINKTVATVKYSLEPEAREWGIKSMDAMARNVSCSINWWCYEDELSEDEIQSLVAAGGTVMRGGTIEGSFEINSDQKFNDKDWAIENSIKFGEDGSLRIDEVTIELDTNIITVSSE